MAVVEESQCVVVVVEESQCVVVVEESQCVVEESQCVVVVVEESQCEYSVKANHHLLLLGRACSNGHSLFGNSSEAGQSNYVIGLPLFRNVWLPNCALIVN